MSFPPLPRFCRAYSFDLFDTLLGRIYALPEDLFLRLGTMVAACSATTFAEQRKTAEFELRQISNFQKEVTLRQIYDSLAARLGWNQATRDRVLAAELQLEAEAIYTIPQGLRLLTQARTRDKRILFVSDTYLPKDFLEQRLILLGILQARDHCYFSSEHGVMKSTGELFSLVSKTEGLAPRQIVHIGDNPVSDGEKARNAGFRAVSFNPTLPTRYEEPSAIFQSIPTISLYNGTRKKLRLHTPPFDRHQSVIYETTIAVSAPLIVTYTAWCLKQAKQRNLNRLYFLARDGEILFQVAKLLAPSISPSMGLHYLYASRQALLLPAILGEIHPEMSWILARTAVLTPRIALMRVGIRPEQAIDALTQAGFPPSVWDRHLSDEARQHFGSCLLAAPIANLIKTQAQSTRTTTLAYFRQEGLCTDPHFAVVDVGWNGTLQRSISRLLESVGRSGPVTGLYFGLHSRRTHKPSDVMLACMSDYQSPTRLDSIDYLVPLLELFFAARHGGVAGYTLGANNRIQPVLRNDQNPTGTRWGIAVQHRAILDLAAAWAKFPELLDHACLRDIMTERLELFARTPSLSEARTYGSYLDSEDQNEAVFVPLARAYRWKELRKSRDQGIKRHHNEWRAGCIALTPAIYRRLLRVENHLEIRHPVCGQGIVIENGFGPVEGPLPKFHLPRFTWLYGPHGRITITSPSQAKKQTLRLQLKNFHANQKLAFICNDTELTALEVPANFGEDRTDTFTMEVELPLRSGINRLDFRPKVWSEGDRPLGVIFCRIELL